jgi:hypothetical protein
LAGISTDEIITADDRPESAVIIPLAMMADAEFISSLVSRHFITSSASAMSCLHHPSAACFEC